MAPGAKKKNANKKSGDSISNNMKGFKNNSDDKIDDNSVIPLDIKEPEGECDSNQRKKYSKRSVASNWQRYEETTCDPFADTMRGKDFEVLLSYSGGSGSHLQLQDEKDWEEANVGEKSIVVDLKDLICVVKSIPFHQQINLPANLFSQDQLSKLESSAENWRNSFTPNLETATNSKFIESYKVPETLDSNLNIIDNCDPEDIQEALPSKSVLLEEKTESIIESLASCLSMKTAVPEKTNDSKVETKKEIQNVPDDLDFLLSLNVSLKNPLQEEKQSENKTNVDDWLNSLLDD